MKCTEKERETCNVEKMGCTGCYYSVGIDFGEGESKSAMSRKIEMTETEKRIRELQQYEYKDKIEIGEYIRTRRGYIRKVIRRDIDKHILVDIGFEGANYLTKIEEKEDIIKHSKNIIDLIEDGDIVEIEISEEFVEKEDKIKFIIIGDTFTTEEFKKAYTKDFENGIYKIKSIVTKEQFKNIEYKV